MIRRGIAAVLAAFLAGAAAGAAAQSFKPFVVKDIRAEGLQRTEPGTVFSGSRWRTTSSWSTSRSGRPSRKSISPA
jgi:outer membrane protein insertion porin family